MLKPFSLWLLEKRLRLHTGKYDAYLNQVFESRVEYDFPGRIQIAMKVLKEPKFSRMRAWAEYQRRQNQLIPPQVSPTQGTEKPNQSQVGSPHSTSY